MSDFTRTQLDQITAAVLSAIPAAHECKFTADDRQNIHEFCRMLDNGGLPAIREMIALSKQISSSKRVAWFLFVSAGVSGVITVVILGVKAWLKSLMK